MKSMFAKIKALPALIVIFLACFSTGTAQAAVPPLNPGFYWGVSTSGYQVEGYSKPTNWPKTLMGRSGVPVGNSVDFYHHYPSDIRLAKNLGVNVFRIGVEWSRLEPSPGNWDAAGFGFYDRVLSTIRAQGMRPMITLDHWTYPEWVYNQGGWKQPEIQKQWLAYAHKAVDHFARYNPIWITFNEPEMKLMLELLGKIDPAAAARLMKQSGSKPNTVRLAVDILSRIVESHRDIYHYIHHRQPGALVGLNTAYSSSAQAMDQLIYSNLSDVLDFFGIDYYYSPTSHISMRAPWTNQQYTKGIYDALAHYSSVFPGKPLYIVENGIPTNNGHARADGYTRSQHLKETIYWVQRAHAAGINVIGYNYWSLLDNFEWGSYAPRFGLYTVNVTRHDLKRIPTPAVETYRTIISAHGVPSDFTPSH